MCGNGKRVKVICKKEEVWRFCFSPVINWVERLIAIGRSLRLLFDLDHWRKSTCSRWLPRGFLRDGFVSIMKRFYHTQRVLTVWWSIIDYHNRFFPSELKLNHSSSVMKHSLSAVLQNVTFVRRFLLPASDQMLFRNLLTISLLSHKSVNHWAEHSWLCDRKEVKEKQLKFSYYGSGIWEKINEKKFIQRNLNLNLLSEKCAEIENELICDFMRPKELKELKYLARWSFEGNLWSGGPLVITLLIHIKHSLFRSNDLFMGMDDRLVTEDFWSHQQQHDS